MRTTFWVGAREGFGVFFPLSMGLIPWALVTGMTMSNTGFTVLQAVGMNALVYAGTAQLATLPMMAAGAPVWLMVVTALVLNLRFVIFSAAIAKGFRHIPFLVRCLSGYLLVDGVFACSLEKMLSHEDKDWRLGYYLAPSIWAWFLWQVFGIVGVLARKSIPSDWSLEFMATIALMLLLIPMTKFRPMLMAAIVGSLASVLLRALPLKLGVFAAIFLGVLAGFITEYFQEKTPKKEIGDA
jgi:predicted branched-subunit amino acid permease